jgi:hypothetical protein
MRHKLTVITDSEGKVLVTQLGHGDVRDPKSGILGSIVAGPGQTLHKIEFDVPQMTARADVEAFHKKLADHLSKGGSSRKA